MKTDNIYIGVLLVCMVSVLCIQCTAQKTSPPEIIGVWTTDDDYYNDETMEFTLDKFIICSTYGTYENKISKIESSKGHLYNSTLYSISYVNREEEECLMNFIYSPEDGGTLMLKALQDIVWKRE